MAQTELNLAPRRGTGPAPKEVEVTVVRALGEGDVALLSVERAEAPQHRVSKIRDRHHALARCIAMGQTAEEASAVTGYDPGYISIMKADPTFAQLVDFYQNNESASMADFMERATVLTLSAMNEIADRLDSSPEEFSVSALLEVSKTFADRTGRAPVQRSVNVNATVDVGARMEAAPARLQKAMGGG